MRFFSVLKLTNFQGFIFSKPWHHLTHVQEHLDNFKRNRTRSTAARYLQLLLVLAALLLGVGDQGEDGSEAVLLLLRTLGGRLLACWRALGAETETQGLAVCLRV